MGWGLSQQPQLGCSGIADLAAIILATHIDSWTTIWGGHIAVLFVGLVLLGATAFFVYAVFVLHVLRDRI
jgi:hypothetical protein